jgi:hypothetical protein
MKRPEIERRASRPRDADRTMVDRCTGSCQITGPVIETDLAYPRTSRSVPVPQPRVIDSSDILGICQADPQIASRPTIDVHRTYVVHPLRGVHRRTSGNQRTIREFRVICATAPTSQLVRATAAPRCDGRTGRHREACGRSCDLTLPTASQPSTVPTSASRPTAYARSGLIPPSGDRTWAAYAQI